MDKIKCMQNEIICQNNIVLVTFALTNMFYLPIMFLTYLMPFPMVVLLSTMAGAIVAGVIMTKVTCAAEIEGTESIARKLRYFPVTKKQIRKNQYVLCFKTIGKQIGLLMIPLVLTAFKFNFKNGVGAVLSLAFTMLVESVWLIEMNLFHFGRK